MRALALATLLASVVAAPSFAHEICNNPPEFAVCEDITLVGYDFTNSRKDIFGLSTSEGAGLIIEGESGDEIAIYEVDSYHNEGNYTVYVGEAGSLKISKNLKVSVQD